MAECVLKHYVYAEMTDERMGLQYAYLIDQLE